MLYVGFINSLIVTLNSNNLIATINGIKTLIISNKIVINPSLLSIKGLSQACADDLYELSQKQKFGSFIELLAAMKKIQLYQRSLLPVEIQI